MAPLPAGLMHEHLWYFIGSQLEGHVIVLAFSPLPAVGTLVPVYC